MRIVLLFLALAACPLLGLAQTDPVTPSYGPGTYVLAASPGVVQRGELQVKRNGLLVRDATGQKIKLKAKDLVYCRIGGTRHVALGTLTIPDNLGGHEVHDLLVLQLDSGQVMLYSFGQTNTTMLSTGLPASTSTDMYALQRRYDSRATAVKAGTLSSGGQQFRDAVRPFLNSRPDLLRLLDGKRITMTNLPEAIRSLNHNLPFTPPAALNME